MSGRPDTAGAPGLFHVVVVDDVRRFAVRMTAAPLSHGEAITFRGKLLVDGRRGRGRWSTVVPVEDFTPCPSPGCGNGWAFRQERAALCPDCAPAGSVAPPAPPQPAPATASVWSLAVDRDLIFGDDLDLSAHD